MIYPQARMDIYYNPGGCWDAFDLTRTQKKESYDMSK